MDLLPDDVIELDNGPWQGVVCDPPFDENGYPRVKCIINWKGKPSTTINDERVQSIGSVSGDNKEWIKRTRLIKRPLVEDTRSYLEAITNEKLGGS